MGEIADRVGDFVTAYSGDLRDESLDGQRLVVCGIVVGSRTIITRARATMAAVTLEDLQGSLEVIVFPRLYEQTIGTWADGSILVVAGRVDHRGEEVSLLADLVLPWDDVASLGPEAFARQVAAGDRAGPRRRSPVPVGPGVPAVPGNGARAGGNGHAPVAAAEPVAAAVGADLPRGLGRRPDIAYVSPLRGGRIPDAGPLELATVARAVALPPIAPAEPLPTYPGSPTREPIGSPEHDDEPALPDEAREREAASAMAPTQPVQAPETDSVLHAHFRPGPAGGLVEAMRAFQALVRERPGETRVVAHVPGPGGAALPMELRTPVAYDAELLAEVRRRLGEGIVDLRLA